MDLARVHRIATRAAYRAGKVLRSFQGNLTEVRKKGAIDLVTEADVASEQVILETIGADFPTHSILAEESGETVGDSSCQWIVDPLDGTTNFAHGLPIYSVSIAFARDGEVLVGLVLNPATGELFRATRGQGATLNDTAIRVSSVSDLSDSLLVTGFPYNFQEIMAPLMARFSQCLSATQGVRRLGSAAIDLCYVACGRFEGFWEQNLNPWDTAAGMLIVREAGGVVTDFANQPFRAEMPEILATNGLIHREMLARLILEP